MSISWYCNSRLPQGIRPVWLRVLFIAIVLFAAWPQAQASDAAAQNLRTYYQTVREALLRSTLGIPLKVSSQVQDDVLSADVSALLATDFDTVATQLSQPASWCEFVPLNPNIKACTYTQRDDSAGVTFYAGRKHYQTSERAEALNYRFDVLQRNNDYLHIQLASPHGPMDTEDHNIELYALRTGQKTYVRIRSSYREGLTARLATQLYMKTLGRNKVGFSTVDTDAQGNPVFVQGVKGIVERNVVRYALAVRAFLDTLSVPVARRFDARISAWFDLTEYFPRQLHEMERATYLDIKRREHSNQLKLQGRLRNAKQDASARTSGG